MILYLLLALSLVISAIAVLAFSVPPIFLLLLAAGLWVGLCTLFLLFLFVCSLFCNPKKPLEKDNAFCRVLAYLTMDGILALFRFRIRGEGLGDIPAEPCVIVCNHLSRFDPMVTFRLLPGRRLGFVSKKENMRIPIVGPITQRIGFVSLDRENPLRAMRAIHSAARLVSEKGFTLGIYPEGTRSKSGELLEFKTGAFVMAKKAKCPIVVSTVRGTNEYRGRAPFRTTPVTFSVLKVVPAEQVASQKPEELAEECRSIMKENLL